MSTLTAPQITIAGFQLPEGAHIDIDPLDGTHHVLPAVTGPGGVVTRVRLWVPERERADWKRVMAMMRALEDATI